MSQCFFLSVTNPNDGVGGGGCLCSPVKSIDSVGPFAIFPGTETDSNLSPHTVLCVGSCAADVVHKAHDQGDDILSAGEDDFIEAIETTATEIAFEDADF